MVNDNGNGPTAYLPITVYEDTAKLYSLCFRCDMLLLTSQEVDTKVLKHMEPMKDVEEMENMEIVKEMGAWTTWSTRRVLKETWKVEDIIEMEHV